MKRLIVLFLTLVCIGTTQAGATCDGCDAAGKARERTVVGHGGPERDLVCFRVLMSDPEDSVAVTIHYGSREGAPITYPTGAAVAMAGNRGELPMVCIPAPKLVGATHVVAIPGSKEGCGDLWPVHIAQLLKERSIPAVHSLCLLKAEVCRSRDTRKK